MISYITKPEQFFQIDSSSQTILIIQVYVFNVVNQAVGRKICAEINCTDDRFSI